MRSILQEDSGSPVVKKTPNPVDRHVGSRVRMRRILLGMSQEKLGEQLQLTFQQIQKYEKGMNRIGASRLQQISRILGVPVEYFLKARLNSVIGHRLKTDLTIRATRLMWPIFWRQMKAFSSIAPF